MKPRFRAALLLLALVLAVCAGVGVASALGLGDRTATATDPEAAHFQPQPGTARLGAGAPDPRGRDRWTVRMYRSEDGSACADVGRIRGQSFGRVDPDDTFHRLDLQPSGACGDTAAAPFTFAVQHYPARGPQPATAAIFGTVTDQVQSITVEMAAGVQDVPIADGSFLLVVADEDLAGGEAEVRLADGTTQSYQLHTAQELADGAAGAGAP